MTWKRAWENEFEVLKLLIDVERDGNKESSDRIFNSRAKW